MAKRFLTLLIMASLLGGTSGLAEANQHDFETRGTRDYALRPLVYPLFAVGAVLDFVLLRPINYIACSIPDLTGCTPQERRSLGLEETYQDIPSEPTQ